MYGDKNLLWFSETLIRMCYYLWRMKDANVRNFCRQCLLSFIWIHGSFDNFLRVSRALWIIDRYSFLLGYLFPANIKKKNVIASYTCLEIWLSEYLRMTDNYLIFRFIQGKFCISSMEADNGKEKEEKRNRILSLHMNFS